MAAARARSRARMRSSRLSCTSMMAAMWHARPTMCTGMMARVRRVILRSASAGSGVSVSSISATMGTAPTARTARAVAMKVQAGTMTSSPGPMPRPTRAQIRALVPLLTVRAYLTPTFWASSSSSRSENVPCPPKSRINLPLRMTRATASILRLADFVHCLPAFLTSGAGMLYGPGAAAGEKADGPVASRPPPLRRRKNVARGVPLAGFSATFGLIAARGWMRHSRTRAGSSGGPWSYRQDGSALAAVRRFIRAY